MQDYLKVLSCLLNEGKSPIPSGSSVQILKPETVKQMFLDSLKEDVTGDLEKPIPTARVELTNDCLLQPG